MFKKNIYLLFALLILNVILLVILINVPKQTQKISQDFKSENLAEIAYLNKQKFSFDQLADYFKKLSQKKTAKYAYEVLKRATLPPNIDLHLLGHVVGDELYKQEGFDGIYACTNDFRNACSHSIVVGLFTDKGEEALSDIASACRNAPGGKGAYTMCFHGLGHGILAYYGYDMEKTAESCKKTATAELNNREMVECVGGSVMEIIGGGFHDRKLWEKQRSKYLNIKEPLRLCSSDFVPAEAKGQCLLYLTPYLFLAAGADLGNPKPADFKKAFTFCSLIPKKDIADREACFGGFGKEFVVLAKDRDVRLESIENMSEAELKKIYDWCLLAEESDGTKSCLMSSLNSLYWGGENKVELSIRFCGIIPTTSYQDDCYKQLIGNVSFYIIDKNYKTNFCEKLPENYRGECLDRLIN